MNYLRKIQSFVTTHSNPILIGTGLATLLGGVTALIPISFKAGKKVAKIEAERGEKISKPELVNLVWKDYITPTFGVLTGTGLIVFGAVKQEMKISDLTIALATANSASSNKVKKITGLENGYETDTKENPKKELSSEGCQSYNEIEWFYDELTNNLFRSTENEVMAKLNEFNAMLVRDGYADVDSYCDYMDLRNILYASDAGWDGIRGPLDISFRGDLVDNKAVKVIELSRSPGRV